MSELSGVEHYREAQRLLAVARGVDDGSTMSSVCHGMLALAAATALSTVVDVMGDSAQVTAWADAIDPGRIHVHVIDGDKPDHWPPKHGDIWHDKRGDRWCCQQDGTLACMAYRADDSADEILKMRGWLTLVHRFEPREEEPPF